jgi:hypothetical protein
MNYSPETAHLMHRALKLAGCWCTEAVWYAPKVAAIRCTRCLALDAIAHENPEAVDG